MFALVAVDLDCTRFLLGLVEDPAPGDLVWVLDVQRENLYGPVAFASLDPGEWRAPARTDLAPRPG